MYGTKIRLIRELRGFSQENMAAKLGVTQSAYSRIETNQMRLDTVMLEKIAGELGVNAIDIMSSEPAVVNFAPNQGTQGIGHIENFYASQKELIDMVIASKDQEIETLKTMIASLQKEKEILLHLLESKQ